MRQGSRQLPFGDLFLIFFYRLNYTLIRIGCGRRNYLLIRTDYGNHNYMIYYRFLVSPVPFHSHTVAQLCVHLYWSLLRQHVARFMEPHNPRTDKLANPPPPHSSIQGLWVSS